MRNIVLKNFVVIEAISGSGKTERTKELVEKLNKRDIETIYNTEPTKGNPMPFGRIIREIIESHPIDIGLVNDCIRVLDISKHAMIPDSMLFNKKIMELASLLNPATGSMNSVYEKLVGMRENESDQILLTPLELQILYILDRKFDLIHTIIPACSRGIIVLNDRYDLSTLGCGAREGVPIELLWEAQQTIVAEMYRIPQLTVYLRVTPEVAWQRLIRSGKPLDRLEKGSDNLQKMFEVYENGIKFLGEQFSSLTEGFEKTWEIVTIDGDQTPEEVAWNLESKVKRALSL